jgi:hypothetical protein
LLRQRAPLDSLHSPPGRWTEVCIAGHALIDFPGRGHVGLPRELTMQYAASVVDINILK